MAQLIEYKLRVESDESVFLVTFLIDLQAKAVKDFAALAGSQEHITSYDISAEGFREMVAWIKTQEFAGKLDVARTMDIQRFSQKITRNIETQIQIADSIKTGDLESLHYALQIDLEIATGAHDLRLQSHYADYEEHSQSARESQDDRLRGRMPLSFVISPFAGVPLMRLDIGARVMVRPEDPEKEPARSFLRTKGLNPRDTRLEFMGALRSIESIRGSEEILALIDLPGNVKGFIRESEMTLRVKLADTRAARAPGSNRASIQLPTGNILDNPILLYGIAGALIIFASILYVILF